MKSAQRRFLSLAAMGVAGSLMVSTVALADGYRDRADSKVAGSNIQRFQRNRSYVMRSAPTATQTAPVAAQPTPAVVQSAPAPRAIAPAPSAVAQAPQQRSVRSFSAEPTQTEQATVRTGTVYRRSRVSSPSFHFRADQKALGR